MVIFEEMRRAVEAAPPDKLGDVATAIWKAYGAGGLTDEQAEELDGLLNARRCVAQAAPAKVQHLAIVAGGLAKVSASVKLETLSGHSRTGSRPRTPESLPRRRRLAAAGYLPPVLAAAFTAGEQAVLAIIAMEVAKRGKCTLANGHIAALAGVGVTLVKRAVRQARTLGLISVEERRLSRWRSETNVLRVVSREWAAWLRTRLPRASHVGFEGGGGTTRSTTSVGSSRGANSARSGGRRQVGERPKAGPKTPARTGKREADA